MSSERSLPFGTRPLEDVHKDADINEEAILFSSSHLPSRKSTPANITGKEGQNIS